ncbi:MAG: hypothetical protein Q9207_007320, partial [Kuettlingeria erythrocarpa]
MNHAAFHIVYVDKRVSANLDGTYLHEIARGTQASEDLAFGRYQRLSCYEQISAEVGMVQDNLGNLLSSFHGGKSCMAKLSELESDERNLQPILVLLEGAMALETGQPISHVPGPQHHAGSDLRSAMNHSLPSTANRAAAGQETNLLRSISSLIAQSRLSTLIVPLAFIELPEGTAYAKGRQTANEDKPLLPEVMLKCIDDGAADVFFGPLALDRIRSIASHAYRVQSGRLKQKALFQEAKRTRKRSWVGVDDRKPYSYLREEMVSSLMSGICSPDDMQFTAISSSSEDQLDEDPSLVMAFTSWDFSAHDFSEHQLVHAAFLILQHVLSMPELESWRIPAAYNSFVHYHNFRHVIDVMQAIFYFLLCIGTLPPYPHRSASPSTSLEAKSPIGKLLRPFDALTLLISAIGHDVGHPGVNNAFLVALNAPLAQLYNDKSVLESFHCAAYSQILRRYWKPAFADAALRGLMINSILATDMGLHFKYMAQLGNLQERLCHNKGTTGWSPQVLDEYRTLTCGLLIKCADISNVARPFDVAAKWADILQLEFANQGVMENDLGMPTTLFGGPPELGNLTKLANSQNGFMSIFACPLFEAVTDILPCMTFAVTEMRANQHIWKTKIEEQTPAGHGEKSLSSESLLSPRSVSPSRSSSQPELSHPEGLPASQTSSRILTSMSPPAALPESEDQCPASTAPALPPCSDPTTEGHSPDPRRSSLSAQQGKSHSLVDPNASSRRSSSGFLTGYSMPQSLVGRRSSNTSPSQLQLGLSSDSNPHAFPTASAVENVQPGRRGSEGTTSQTNASAVTSDTGSRNAIVPGGGGGSAARKGSKSSDSDQTHSQQRSMTYAIARHSPYSAHERHSSGGHTSRSQSVPYSPTETQATSMTEDSDDKNHQLHERGGSSTITEGIPETFDAEKPGTGHRLAGSGGRGHSKTPDVKTTVLNGGTGNLRSHTDRLMSRKSSRFLNFWKKR